MKSWYDIYKERQNSSYRKHLDEKYSTFINTIISEYQTAHGEVFVRLAEFGCGAANISRIVSDRIEAMRGGSAHLLFDNCPKMLGLAAENMAGKNAAAYQWSILDSSLPDWMFGAHGIYPRLIHSHGVLEHFNDSDINKALDIQRQITPHLVHYVPSSKYEIPSRGDERLMTPQQWRAICSPTEILETNNGFDLILIWR